MRLETPATPPIGKTFNIVSSLTWIMNRNDLI